MKWKRIIIFSIAAILLPVSMRPAFGAEFGPDDMKPRIALTFDDGPHPRYTPRLLDGLKERGVKATFFVVGKHIPEREDIIRRMNEEGHLIGNHTYDHVNIANMSMEDACLQITRTSDLIREITGKDTEYVRPPFGTWNRNLECGIELLPVLWTLDPKDWTTKNVDQIVQNVVSKVKENDIILLHDYYGSSVEATFRIVDLLQAEGYEFATVDELLLE